MAEESSDSSQGGFLGKHYEEVKGHWRRNLAFLDYYKKTLGRAEPLPKWTDADVEEFIASDLVYGPQLKALRESRKYAIVGALLGAAHLGGVSWKYSKSPHGFVLATGFGALCGGVLGSEVAEHWKQLYKIDKQGANLRFLYWWEDKTVARGYLLESKVGCPTILKLVMLAEK
ncbi:succinate dehydrogenase subunit 6, mitochondrial-like isoform X2 [Phoenix dactylifera]|uniref:Succinate dehydrogenase subunit 6, mitochondrial-like isoform X2 n=1 Tax=Phoenix dactylifera TaxID=42345 RepID=A0A8B9AX79_PHODC|nr:succinate dehydrogenase subunit 6, mitochondrial-like isoform X2 [Phoenix dactylifera]